MHSFKKTILAVLALLLCVCVLFAGYTVPYFYGTAYYYQDAAARNALSGELNLLICGSSHAFRGIDPTRIDAALGTNSYNLACSMQTMKGRYFLLREELERNPVQTVILEVSYNSLTRNREWEGPEGDLYELGRFTSPLDRWRYFFFTAAPSEYPQFFHDTLSRSTTAWKALLKGAMGLQSVRGSLGLDPVAQSAPQQVPDALVVPEEKNEESARYFEKCLALCAENNVRVILVTTPMPERTVITAAGLDRAYDWLADYAAQYGCEFYDFNLIKTRRTDYPDSTAFFDNTHLSRYGAQTFTDALCDVLQRQSQGENVSALFYESYDTLEIGLRLVPILEDAEE